jgi:hypothetical protein
MSAACRTDLCREGRSPCPTPSACTGLKQTSHGARIDTRAHCSTPTEARPPVCLHRGGLFGLNDAPIEGHPDDGPIAGEWRGLRWAVPATVLLALAASIVWPWGMSS